MATANLRERKKRDTHLALSEAAQELVHRHGLERVTIDDIADAAGVSVRTFFNYFPCKEEAVVGVEAGVLVELGDELRARPAHEGPVEALRAVLVGNGDPGAVLRRWQLRNELVNRYPALLPRHLASMVHIEVALARALADRLGVDPATDPSARILVAAVLAGLRAGLAWWEESGRTESLDMVFEWAFTNIVADPPKTRKKP
jgi:AcrR family transcriptional regulator